MIRRIRCVLIMLPLTLTPAPTACEAESLPHMQEWRGARRDESLATNSPTLVVDSVNWERLWRKWRFAEELPQVDFATQFAIVATTVGAGVSFSPTADENGRLSINAMSTADIRPGFRFTIATVSRAGIKVFEQPTQQWTGSVDDLGETVDLPYVVTRRGDWEKIWTSWKFAELLPHVDFSQQFAVIGVTRGSRLRLSTRIDDKGDLRVAPQATRDFLPGYRYVVATFLRQGVRTVNGEHLRKSDQVE